VTVLDVDVVLRDSVLDDNAEVETGPDPLVGRTGGAAVDKGGQVNDPQARSVWQQPPPRLAGHVWKPGLQVNGPWPEDEGLIGVEEIGDVVGAVEGGRMVVVWTTVVVKAFPEVVTTNVVVVVQIEAVCEPELAGITNVWVVVLSDNVDHEAPVVTVTIGNVVVVVAVDTYTPDCHVSTRSKTQEIWSAHIQYPDTYIQARSNLHFRYHSPCILQ
jgi:hypothetical protein